MSTDTAFTNIADEASCAHEAAMLSALAAMLRRGAFVIEEVEALVAVESDAGAEADARVFARRSLGWLAQQSVAKRALTCSQNADDRQ